MLTLVTQPLLAVLLILAITAIIFSKRVRNACEQLGIDVLSCIINKYLLYKYPIYSADGSRTPIPSCPYRFPNGQGDVGKFIEGEKNSDTWSKEHGIIYRIWSGMTPEIVLTRPEDVKIVFRDSDLHFKAINNDTGYTFGELLGRCLGMVSGKEWQHMRLATGASFTKKNAGSQIPKIESLISEHFMILQNSSTKLKQGLLSPVDDLRMISFWAVAHHLYGELSAQAKTELERLVPIREKLIARAIQGGLARFSWSRYLPTTANRELVEFKKSWIPLNDNIHASCISSHSKPAIVNWYQEVKSGSMTAESMYQTLDEMLFANLDVTIGAMSWNIPFLAAHPSIQSSLRSEIREARNSKDGHPGNWEEYLLSPSTLLESCILESGRLRPLAPFTVSQSAPTDRVISGFVIPAGTNFIVDAYALNQHNPYWGNDTSEYRPQRFQERKTSEMRYHYWRYGFGPRQCLGKYLADLVIRLVLVYLVENYELALIEEGKGTWERNVEMWITQPNTHVRCLRLAKE